MAGHLLGHCAAGLLSPLSSQVSESHTWADAEQVSRHMCRLSEMLLLSDNLQQQGEMPSASTVCLFFFPSVEVVFACCEHGLVFVLFFSNSRWFLPRNGSPEKPTMTSMTWLSQLLFSRWLLDSRGYSPSIIYRRNLWLWESTDVWLIARSMLVLSDVLILWMGQLCRKLFFLETSWKKKQPC